MSVSTQEETGVARKVGRPRGRRNRPSPAPSGQHRALRRVVNGNLAVPVIEAIGRGVETLRGVSEAIGADFDTVRTSVRNLTAAGFVRVSYREGRKPGRHRTFYLSLDRDAFVAAGEWLSWLGLPPAVMATRPDPDEPLDSATVVPGSGLEVSP